ncbi:MAG: DNA-processing protein DprA, partial [Clostridia bacterium]|nr:DNA-processing protein DprA [Clostridia bacterium]
RRIAWLQEGLQGLSAGEQSGTRSTVEFATASKKAVFAVPYSLGVAAGKGCNDMIKDGASLCDGIDDILLALRIDNKTRTADVFEEADGDEAAVLNLLKTEGEMHAEKIAARLKMKLTDVVTACSMLEIKGLVVRTVGNSYAII